MLEDIKAIDLTFKPNITLPRHRWYPLAEGFAASFVEKCLVDFGATSRTTVLDPFAGCGTTPLVAAASGLDGVFCEVNPLLGFAARTKLRHQDATLGDFGIWAKTRLRRVRPLSLREVEEQSPQYQTLRRDNSFDRWLFDDHVLSILLPIVANARTESGPRGELLLLAVARALEPLCNAKRDGKAMRYKHLWRARSWTRTEVYEEIERAVDLIREDLEVAPLEAGVETRFFQRSAFDALPELEDESVDVVITSPPYLNSRDYTDLYNPDMWLLGFIASYEQVRELRASCVDSHVQLPGRSHRTAPIAEVEEFVERFQRTERKAWLRRLPQMIGGYFGDLAELLRQLTRILRPGGAVYINVAESAYCGVKIPTLKLVENLGEHYGFDCEDHIVRRIRRSGQQFHTVTELLEGVVCLRS